MATSPDPGDLLHGAALSRRLFCGALLSGGFLSGCTSLHLPDWDKLNPFDKEDRLLGEDDDDSESLKPRTELIGHFASIAGNNVIVIHGVGLVTGLDNTGEDPPPSLYRTQLLTDMQKRGVKEPNKILQSLTTALVQITAYLSADVRKGDTFDVEVRLPPNSEATSLAGGWLMEARLSEKELVPGRELQGHDFAICKGPILISTGEGDKTSLAGVLKRGKVLGGAVALKERNLGLYLRNDYRSVRNSKRISDIIGRRFHSHDAGGHKKPMATAKTDQYVELMVHPRYKDNYPRYMQVVRSIAFRENDVQQRERMERLRERIGAPETSARAAIELESIGLDAIPQLKDALQSELLEVKFYAAEALAYLGDPAGAETLFVAARDEPAFRVYALAALTALDDATSFEHLRELMNQPSAETRYGAFRALWTLDKDDPYIKGRKLNDQFFFHIIDSDTEPMIHLTRHKIPEIVLFGRDQKLITPLTLTAGSKINVNAPAGSDVVTVSRFELGRPDQKQLVSTRVADVIEAVAEMGATYPDVAQLLSQAARQFNIPGRIEIDALPQGGRMYMRPAAGEEQAQKAQVGKPALMPNLFPATREAPEGPELTPPEKPEKDEPPEKSKKKK